MGRFLWVVAIGWACSGEVTEEAAAPEAAPPALKSDFGVDVAARVISIGALNDESGPAATIGKPFADGKRLLAARIDTGVSGLLPVGWSVRLVERDHRYDPDAAVRAYREIADEVLFVGTSFGTPNTAPLQELLERDGMVAFPASLSSQMANHAYTPPLAPSYRIEAMRAVDWVATQSRSARLGLVYQADDYGTDALVGLEASARHHRLTIAATETIVPGQKDFGPVIASLRTSGATHVLLATLPSTTGPLLRTAYELGYTPTWIGHTPAWSDKFFLPTVIPSGVFATYRQTSVLPYWGEEVPGMAEFEAAWKTYGGSLSGRDSNVLVSYLQGLVQIEAARRAIASGDITRAGYLSALRSIDGWDAGGMVQPVSLATFPYVVGTKARVLKPDFAASSWTVVAPYADPAALVASASAEPWLPATQNR